MMFETWLKNDTITSINYNHPNHLYLNNFTQTNLLQIKTYIEIEHVGSMVH